MTARDDIENRILAKALAEATITPSAPIHHGTLLRAELGFTSLQAVNLILDLEQEFGVVIDEPELAHVRTVGDIVDLVRTRLNRPPGAAA